MKHYASKILSFVLILSVLWLFYNAVVNWHFHVLPDGTVTIHSHIYTPSAKNSDTPTPFESHKHSDFEYKVLSQIFLLTTLVFIASVLLNFFQTKSFVEIRPCLQVFISRTCISHLQLRAPPIW